MHYKYVSFSYHVDIIPYSSSMYSSHAYYNSFVSCKFNICIRHDMYSFTGSYQILPSKVPKYRYPCKVLSYDIINEAEIFILPLSLQDMYICPNKYSLCSLPPVQLSQTYDEHDT